MLMGFVIAQWDFSTQVVPFVKLVIKIVCRVIMILKR